MNQSINEKLRRAYRTEGLLYAFHIDLTWRCPLSCRHCYLSAPTEGPELATDEVVGLFVAAREMGALNVVLSGGELFLREDACFLVEEARKRLLQPYVKTSAWSLSPDRLDRLVRARPAQVDISFYSDESSRHDAVTGQTGSFARALSTLLRLQDNGVFAAAVVTLLRGYEEDAQKVKAGLLAAGIRHVGFNSFFNTRCGGGSEEDLWVNDKTLLEQWRCAPPEMADDWHTKGPDARLCSAGLDMLYVAPDGRVFPCTRLPLLAGNVREQPLSEIWNESPVFQELRALRFKDLEGCVDCSVNRYCDYCMAQAYADTGQLNIPSPGMCRQARLRRAAFVREED